MDPALESLDARVRTFVGREECGGRMVHGGRRAVELGGSVWRERGGVVGHSDTFAGGLRAVLVESLSRSILFV